MLSPFGSEGGRDAIEKMTVGSGHELAASPSKRWLCCQALPKTAAEECGPVGEDVLV
jgi:hypothetical protein